jgi:hypothetical protein
LYLSIVLCTLSGCLGGLKGTLGWADPWMLVDLMLAVEVLLVLAASGLLIQYAFWVVAIKRDQFSRRLGKK